MTGLTPAVPADARAAAAAAARFDGTRGAVVLVMVCEIAAASEFSPSSVSEWGATSPAATPAPPRAFFDTTGGCGAAAAAAIS